MIPYQRPADTAPFRHAATVTLIAFLAMLISPTAEAVRNYDPPPAPKPLLQPTQAAPLPRTSVHADLHSRLAALQRTLGPAQERVIKRLRTTADGTEVLDIAIVGTPEAAELAESQRALAQLRDRLVASDAATRAAFDRARARLLERQLPQVIIARHDAAVERFERASAAVREALAGVEGARTLAELSVAGDALASLLVAHPVAPSFQPLDYERLPFGVNDAAETRAPAATDEELKARFPVPDAELASQGLTQATILAASVLGMPVPEDLQANPDVQITPAIRALAESLDNNPVKIHNWVHDHVEYLPTWLSTQGSQRTLESRRGNAFDIASLTIALLRAAGIPARYQYGTVRVPEAGVRNWLGNLESPHAAMNLMLQGGIPTEGKAVGGRIAYIQFEHVWVKAWVDFHPGRGFSNLEPDTWVPMDPAFKQYQYSDGLDLPSEAPFDAEGFVDELLEGAVVDEANGTVQGLDPALIENAFGDYLERVNQYVEQQNPDATVADVIGARRIIARESDTLAASLPYQLIAEGNHFATLPDTLRARYEFKLYASPRDRALGNPVFSFGVALPELANQRLSLSFEPASDEDRQTIESYLPEPDEEGNIDPADLPDRLPGYLIELNAQLKLDGQIIRTAGPFKMGAELATHTAITRLTGGTVSATNYPIAGEFHAFAINLPGGAGEDLAAIQARLETTRDQLQAEQYDGLTKDALVGDLLAAAGNAYFAALGAQAELLNRATDGTVVMHPGFGLFNTALEPEYRYGIPRSVAFTGIGGDFDGVIHGAVNSANDPQRTIQLVQQMGAQLSALEHRIPELLFTDENNPGEAASTVKALTVAAAQGQTIHTITRDTLSQLDQITAAEVIKDDIRNGVNAGLVATCLLYTSPSPRDS